MFQIVHFVKKCVLLQLLKLMLSERTEFSEKTQVSANVKQLLFENMELRVL